MTPSDPYLKFAFALNGLIRSLTKGDGGREYSDKCTREIAEALREIVTPSGKPSNDPHGDCVHQDAKSPVQLS